MTVSWGDFLDKMELTNTVEKSQTDQSGGIAFLTEEALNKEEKTDLKRRRKKPKSPLMGKTDEREL